MAMSIRQNCGAAGRASGALFCFLPALAAHRLLASVYGRACLVLGGITLFVTLAMAVLTVCSVADKQNMAPQLETQTPPQRRALKDRQLWLIVRRDRPPVRAAVFDLVLLWRAGVPPDDVSHTPASAVVHHRHGDACNAAP